MYLHTKVLTISQSVEHTITPEKAISPKDRGSHSETEDLSDLISPSSGTPSGSAHDRYRSRDSGLSPFQMPINGRIGVIIERQEDLEDSVEELFDPKQSKRNLSHSTIGSELAHAIARAKKHGTTISNEGLNDVEIQMWMHSQSGGSHVKHRARSRESVLVQHAKV